MNRKPRFLICRNTIVSPREFILHTKAPRFLAEIFPFNDDEKANEFKESTPLSSSIKASDRSYVVAIRELYEGGVDSKVLAESVLLGHMAEWLRFYLNHEEITEMNLSEEVLY
ncbi:MAG: hypothetical protein ACEPOV_05440 [Hyphomicrobiales bacterium]